MKSTLVAIVPILLAGLAGCTSEPEPKAVDFSNVDASQPGGRFTLHVKVVGVGNETEPLGGAFVGAAHGTDAIAKSTTDASGEATLKVKSGQTIKIVAKAPGWTTEDSGEVSIGDVETSEAKSDCGSFTMTLNGQTQSQSWCVVTASDSSPPIKLSGSEGRVSIALFQKVVDQKFLVSAGPQANARAVVLPDGQKWIPQTKPLNKDPDLARLYMLRLVETHTKLEWRNNLLEQGDFELGVGCVRDAPASTTSNTVPYLTKQEAKVTVVKDWNPKMANSWADCPAFFAGPVVDTVNSPITVEVAPQLVFKGKSSIIPVNEQ